MEVILTLRRGASRMWLRRVIFGELFLIDTKILGLLSRSLFWLSIYLRFVSYDTKLLQSHTRWSLMGVCGRYKYAKFHFQGHFYNSYLPTYSFFAVFLKYSTLKMHFSHPFEPQNLFKDTQERQLCPFVLVWIIHYFLSRPLSKFRYANFWLLHSSFDIFFHHLMSFNNLL